MTAALQRLFVALPVPDTLAHAAAALPRTLPGARWLDADSLHITLRFLGDVTAEVEEAAARALTGIRRAPFTVVVAGLGLFEHPDGGVLYGRVESVRAVTDLCARITDRLVPLGFDFGARPFVPHVTLARVHIDKNIDKYMKINGKNINLAWQAHEFRLMRSGGDGAYSTKLKVDLHA